MNTVCPKRMFTPKTNIVHPWQKEPGQPILSNVFFYVNHCKISVQILLALIFLFGSSIDSAGCLESFGTTLPRDARGLCLPKAATPLCFNSAFLGLINLSSSPAWRKEKKKWWKLCFPFSPVHIQVKVKKKMLVGRAIHWKMFPALCFKGLLFNTEKREFIGNGKRDGLFFKMS